MIYGAECAIVTIETRTTKALVLMALTSVMFMALKGCTAEESESPALVDCSGVSPSFADDVFPAIQASCTRSG
jgi:hypothetical protein